MLLFSNWENATTKYMHQKALFRKWMTIPNEMVYNVLLYVGQNWKALMAANCT